MTPFLVFLLAVSVISDVIGHICFKRGVDRLPSATGEFHFWTFTRHAFVSLWLWAGVAIAMLELAVWVAILARAPLSLAFPLVSLNYCGVVLAGRFVLNEDVPAYRWAGAVLITIGVIIVGATGKV
ncbi:MAG: transporter [Rhodospirillales bacterium]|nr:transporter [Rhodospirillales bacterium]